MTRGRRHTCQALSDDRAGIRVGPASGRRLLEQAEPSARRARAQVGDPSYFPGKVRKTSAVVRAICLLSHPIPGTNNAASVQIILPQKQARPHATLPYPILAHTPCCAGACGGTGRHRSRQRSVDSGCLR